MKANLKYILLGLGVFSLVMMLASSDVQKKPKLPDELVVTNVKGNGTQLLFNFKAGEAHNHPTLAVWMEDLDGNYLQMLYITQSLATGIYSHGAEEPGIWKREEGEARRPATLPYFLHKRNVIAPDGTFLPTPKNPIPDAYTGATPKSGFNLDTRSDKPLKGKVRVLVEVNQTWDWNEYWSNNKYPDDVDYKTSCQPAVVYAVVIDLDNPMENYVLNPIGHSHYSGQDGKLYTDLTTITTALDIFSKIEVSVVR